MKFCLAVVVLVGAISPAVSMSSYLASLAPAAPQIRGGGGAANGASYLDALNVGASAPVRGAGMATYLDALAPNPSSAMTGGSGLASYADRLSGGASVAAAPKVAVPKPAAPAPVAAAPVSSSASSPVAAGGTYLDTLGTSSGAPTGAGITTYLDALPLVSTAMSGAGIQTYLATLPAVNVAVGGRGMATYMDSLGGGVGAVAKTAYAPSAGVAAASSSSATSTNAGFTFEADDLSELIKQAKGATSGKIHLSGRFDSVSFE
jgi:hypothetical protein